MLGEYLVRLGRLFLLTVIFDVIFAVLGLPGWTAFVAVWLAILVYWLDWWWGRRRS